MIKVTIATLVAIAHASELKSLSSSTINSSTEAGSFPYPANVTNNLVASSDTERSYSDGSKKWTCAAGSPSKCKVDGSGFTFECGYLD